eukprot:UN01777
MIWFGHCVSLMLDPPACKLPISEFAVGGMKLHIQFSKKDQFDYMGGGIQLPCLVWSLIMPGANFLKIEDFQRSPYLQNYVFFKQIAGYFFQ